MAKRLLVIEGDPVLRDLEQTSLTERGFTVDTAADGTGALEHLETTRYDAIVLDATVPCGDGLELARRIKQAPAHQETPIIVVAGRGPRAALREGFLAGVTLWLYKPFAASTFRSAVESVVR